MRIFSTKNPGHRKISGIRFHIQPNLEECRRPTRVLRGHIDLVEVLLEAAIVHAVHLHHVASNPLAELQDSELLTEAALAVTVHDIRERRGREDFIDSRAVELFAGFGTGVEVRNTEADAVRVALLDVLAALHDGGTRTHHVVEHNHVLTLDFFDADVGEFRVERHADFAFACTNLVHHHAFAFRQLESVEHGVHERACALVRRNDDEVVAVLACLNKVAVLDVVGIDVGRNQVVEMTFENFAEEVLNLDAVVVDSHHGIDTSLLQEFGVEEARECLAVKLLEVNIRAILFKFANAVRAAVLGAIEKVRFHEHDLFGTVVLCGAGQNTVAHGVVIAATFMVRNRANQDNLAFETAADMVHIVHV